MASIPPPPEGRFGKWAYQLWDYVAKNRLGAAVNLVAGTGILVGTGTVGTFTVRQATSGVGAGTYGTGVTWPSFSVNVLGQILTATAGGTISSGVSVLAGVVTGTTTTGTLTTAQNFTQGSSTSLGRVAVAGTYNMTAITTRGLTFSLMNLQVPASALSSAGQGVWVRGWGTMPGFLPTRLGFVFGTGTVLVATATNQVVNWNFEGKLIATGAATQRYQARFDIQSAAGSVAQIASGTLGIAASSTFGMSVSGTHLSTASGFNQEGMTLDFRG